MWQQERDLMSYAWQGANQALDRDMRIAVANIEQTGDAGETNAAGDLVSSILGSVATKVVANYFNIS